MKQALAVASKDLRSEARAKEIAPAMVLFALVVVFVFTFVLPAGTGRAPIPEPRAGAVATRDISAVFLWVSIFFAGIIGFSRNASQEREAARIEALLIAPVDPATLFLAKAFANFVYLAVLQLFVLPLFLLFLGASAAILFPGIIPIALLADIGLAAAGTLFAAASQHSRVKDVVLPLLLFPAALPLLLAAIATTTSTMRGESYGSSGWFILMLTFDVIFVTIGITTYEYVISE